MPRSSARKWPKLLPPLTPEQKKISDDFVKQWLELLPRRYSRVEEFNHNYPLRSSPGGFRTTLEIGAGLGEHLHYEKLTPEQEENYVALELRENMAAEIRRQFPRVRTVLGDCQRRTDFPDGFFDRIIAIHVLEHLPDLPGCVQEAWRVLRQPDGRFLVVIPTEGSPAYGLARKISAERVYKKRYGGSYTWFHRREHINRVWEILEELHPYFVVESKRFFPLPWLPFVFCNLFVGLSLRPRLTPLED